MKQTSLHGFGLFSDVGNRRAYAAGDVVFDAGEFAEEMYLVIEGELCLTQDGEIIDELQAGDLFGDMAMVENRPRNSKVTAVTDSVLLPIDRLRFASLVRQHPGFATRVMAIISTRLTRRTKLEVKKRSLERELAIGRKMQRSLLPQNTPQIPGWQFASHYDAAWQVGGDFYDFIPLDEGPTALCLVIADVSGKGVPAALYMAVARTLMRSEARRAASPADVLGQVNEFILSDTRSPLFLSALLAVLELQSGSVRYASAGHNPPLCRREESGEVEELPAQGYLLGAFGDAAFSVEETVLRMGDALVLYTDGVSEARDADGRFFGIERIKAAVSEAGAGDAAEIVRAIVSAVNSFSGAVSQTDDQTILVAKRT